MIIRHLMDAETIDREKGIELPDELDESELAIRFDAKIHIQTSSALVEILSVPLLGFACGIISETIKVIKDNSALGYSHDFYGEYDISIAIEGDCLVYKFEPQSVQISCPVNDALVALIKFGGSVKDTLHEISPKMKRLPVYDKLIDELSFCCSMYQDRWRK